MTLLVGIVVTILIFALICMLNYQAWRPEAPYMRDPPSDWMFRIIVAALSVLFICFLAAMVWPRLF